MTSSIESLLLNLIIHLIVAGMLFRLHWSYPLIYLMLIILSIYVKERYSDSTHFPLPNHQNVSRETLQAEENGLLRSPIATLMYDDQQIIRWLNPEMQYVFGTRNVLGKSLLELNPDFTELITESKKQSTWQTYTYQEHTYRTLLDEEYRAFYMFDVTKEMKIYQSRNFDRLIFGYLYIDNYDELSQLLDDQQLLSYEAYILTTLHEWAESKEIYLKRTDDDHFLMLLNKATLDKLEEDKFKAFEVIKKSSHQKNYPLYVSMGIAYSEDEEYSVTELEQQANLNLELALGRGGDQIVIRAKDQRARFYGGLTNPTEKRGNIRSRRVYQALKNSMKRADQIFIVGHKNPDLDAISSALAVHNIATQLNKSAKIIINQEQLNHNIRDLLKQPQISYRLEQVFIDLSLAEKQHTKQSLLIMVDHHRPSLSDAQPLVNEMDVVIIDHHRRSEEFPKHSVLTYIEPYASSTAELVTEFFSYPGNELQGVNRFEATALLAGIIVDTNNFTARTGSRTFDVASYLRSRGADMTLIQRLLKEDLTNVVERNRLVEASDLYFGQYAIACGQDHEIIDSVTAAQAADYLLKLKNVEASFVIYQRDESTVGISARSLGQINVQLIMEALGGGGHLSNAATQIESDNIQKVKELLINNLKEEEENSE